MRLASSTPLCNRYSISLRHCRAALLASSTSSRNRRCFTITTGIMDIFSVTSVPMAGSLLLLMRMLNQSEIVIDAGLIYQVWQLIVGLYQIDVAHVKHIAASGIGPGKSSHLTLH
ncbi:hypothetical protein Dsin_008347 [Dipteronia sinensis]|uniref:Uncharacterized protein n=1 Tax=Dipteronia sinensis TaxID=43782 RepID=A0AAE0APR3_9ROSI|nr:hypothetical protein Dsin_008347 [Dipteronia sinensis]